MLCLCANLSKLYFCICEFVYLYSGNMEVVVGEYFQKLFGLCGLECHIVEIWRDVTLVHGRRTDDGT